MEGVTEGQGEDIKQLRKVRVTMKMGGLQNLESNPQSEF